MADCRTPRNGLFTVQTLREHNRIWCPTAGLAGEQFSSEAARMIQRAWRRYRPTYEEGIPPVEARRAGPGCDKMSR